MMQKGLFGKLPGHGDFVQRDLPGSFVTPWDEWLQRAVYGSRELVGERWLEYYLTSPIWRFALSAGVLNQQAWAGVLVPSVDSVGRYFPVTMAVPLPAGSNLFDVQVRAEAWYSELSELAINALQNALLADQLLELFPPFPALAQKNTEVENDDSLVKVCGEPSIAGSYPALLEYLYRERHPSFSLWWCSGSQFLAPKTMLSAGLPDPSEYGCMLGAPKFHW
ncbi:type VI secretion system-associated protein TagF [Microbulbifer pacificus]|uniref:type VI secretion system-associated protein TagF n=1 Tax=Microbulbifer pacificus TaxID=407164 RepID=UPI000CF569A0|nr:type VI secretion system-associated protein TagF [Microbulbifer pacificus]